MKNGKTYEEKINHNFFKRFLIFILVVLIIILIVFVVFYTNKYIKNNPNHVSTSTNSIRNLPKKIIGLENIEITEMNIESSSSSSIIEISLTNISDTKIDSCQIILYLLSKDESVIFGTSLNLTNMEPNSSETFSILCSDNITDVADYKVVLDK